MLRQILKSQSKTRFTSPFSAKLGSYRFFRSDLIGTNTNQRYEIQFDRFYENRVREYTHPKKPALTVAVTGAAGHLGYSALFRLASGQMLGSDQPIYINAIELPHAMDNLTGIIMELNDSAFPLLKGVIGTSEQEKGFENADFALLLGSKPRAVGQERSDLLMENGAIFRQIGKNLSKYAKSTCKTVVVGNPANTNCLICAHNAPNIPIENFTSMMRLDHDRGLAQLAQKTGHNVQDITEFCVQGNHSNTMFPDITNTRILGENFRHYMGNLEVDEQNEKEFIPSIQKRGAEIIKARGTSSAASAANACLSHMYDWNFGSRDGKQISMGIASEGQYGVPKDLICGFPIEIENPGVYKVVSDLPLNSFQEARLKATVDELKAERDSVAQFLS